MGIPQSIHLDLQGTQNNRPYTLGSLSNGWYYRYFGDPGRYLLTRRPQFRARDHPRSHKMGFQIAGSRAYLCTLRPQGRIICILSALASLGDSYRLDTPTCFTPIQQKVRRSSSSIYTYIHTHIYRERERVGPLRGSYAITLGPMYVPEWYLDPLNQRPEPRRAVGLQFSESQCFWLICYSTLLYYTIPYSTLLYSTILY